MELGLTGKVAIITGGSKGIGYYTALQLAQEGASVVLCARGEKQLEVAAAAIKEKTGAQVLIVPADITKEKECQKVVTKAVEHFGRLDILVNNAGTASANPFEQVGSELWQSDLDLKLFGAVNSSKAAIPHMKAAGGGSIINVTAVLAKTPPASSLPTTVSRAAGLALTKAMSKDLGKYNIRVNAVCIGLIRSDQIEKRWKNDEPNLTWEEYSQKVGETIPLGRIGNTEEAANVITFLASNASSYVTGTSINIDGGSGGAL
ncbi:SDR family oxidoreductase [Lysinibacillus louembei]|uniref:SDR family oxidoreductase n=1 Tax=Lysinibacillus louembei TaxID=1470088 RepID=A0ABZ0RXY9_9BACI|nr:SDR family oxidoreductase [Lysinibacillus louembei]WPK12142.1 SDR family oxidoreductase [Lysinibacillus louembei]